MEEYEIEEKGETIEANGFESFLIEDKENKFNLDIKVNYEDKNIILSINDKNQFPPVYYAKTMNLQQIKDLNETFSIFNNFNDFYNYLKSLPEQKRLNIQSEKNKLSITYIFNNLILEKVILF